MTVWGWAWGCRGRKKMGEHGNRGGELEGAWEHAGGAAVGTKSMDDAGFEGGFVGVG